MKTMEWGGCLWGQKDVLEQAKPRLEVIDQWHKSLRDRWHITPRLFISCGWRADGGQVPHWYMRSCLAPEETELPESQGRTRNLSEKRISGSSQYVQPSWDSFHRIRFEESRIKEDILAKETLVNMETVSWCVEFNTLAWTPGHTARMTLRHVVQVMPTFCKKWMSELLW